MVDLSPLVLSWSWWVYPLLFLTGVSAGFVDSIAGGGGIITLPVLLNFGMPAPFALGTNKLQAVFGSGSAAWHYGAAGLIDFKNSRSGLLFTFVGATAGSLAVSRLSSQLLQQTIPWLLVLIAIYLLLQPRLGAQDRRARLPASLFHLLFGMGIGFYDGFFGPGTGTFWAMSYVLARGYDLQRATAHTKLMNVTSNVASLIIFLANGRVHVASGLCMGAGQWLGARLGSRIVIRKGIGWLRPVFISVALAVTVRLFWQNVSAP